MISASRQENVPVTEAVEGMQCPLCHGNSVEIHRTLAPSVLVKLYRETLGIDVGDLFSNVANLSSYRCKDCDFRFFYPAITGPESFYQALRDHGWYYIKEKQEFLIAAQEIGQSDSVLDIGCGDGNFSNYIGAEHYVGLELSGAAAAEARARNLTVFSQTVEEYSERQPASVDVVCAFQVLEHVADPKSFLDASIRCLKPGGRLIVSVPSADSFLRFAINNILNCPPHHVSWWSDEALRSIARMYGLEIRKIFNDVLAEEHLEGYLNALVIRGLDARKQRIGLVDDSFRLRVYSKIAAMLMPMLRRGLAPMEMRPRGHSTTVVFSLR